MLQNRGLSQSLPHVFPAEIQESDFGGKEAEPKRPPTQPCCLPRRFINGVPLRALLDSERVVKVDLQRAGRWKAHREEFPSGLPTVTQTRLEIASDDSVKPFLPGSHGWEAQ